MEYKILVIDDDEPMHIITRGILDKDFKLEHARNVQQAIDLLSENFFNLILSDIHMPGINGLEFLESLMKDAAKKQIPILIMTNLPTVEKEEKALNLGAADFIDKTLFTKNGEEILERVRMKLVTNLEINGLNEELIFQKNQLINEVMVAAIKTDYLKTVRTLCRGLEEQFKTDYISYWSIKDKIPALLIEQGSLKSDSYTDKDFKRESSFKALFANRKPYLTNHVFSNDLGIMQQFCRDNHLPAEIGVPLFAINERMLLRNNMKVPVDAALFGILILKRNRLFASKEFEMVSRLLTQTGSILWRLSGRSN